MYTQKKRFPEFRLGIGVCDAEMVRKRKKEGGKKEEKELLGAIEVLSLKMGGIG